MTMQQASMMATNCWRQVQACPHEIWLETLIQAPFCLGTIVLQRRGHALLHAPKKQGQCRLHPKQTIQEPKSKQSMLAPHQFLQKRFLSPTFEMVSRCPRKRPLAIRMTQAMIPTKRDPLGTDVEGFGWVPSNAHQAELPRDH